jgi:ABC-type transport system involved in cytochrome bd biosynthesis fused ATPase/permease subunit
MIIVLEEGRVSQMGTHEELLARRGFYRRIREQQEANGGEGPAGGPKEGPWRS